MKRPCGSGKFAALIFIVALVSACASTTTPSSQSTSPSPSPSVDAIVASNLAARGGEARLRALQSIRESGTMTGPGGRVAQVVREIKKPGLFRLEFSFQGTTSVFANDGTTGWQVAPLQGQFEPMVVAPEADAAAGEDQRDIEGPLVDWKKKGHVVTLVGRESIDGRDTYELQVVMRGGATRYDYVDVLSHQIVRSDVTRIIRGHATLLETLFSDFRETDGLVFPRRIETHVKDRPEVLKISVESIELNPVLDDERFRKPRQ
jgi:outer membrane lipoprotein-sorting protein